MEEVFSKVESLAENVRDYVNTRIDTVKLTAAEKSSKLLSNLIAGAIVAVVFLLFFLFVNFSIAYALAEWVGKTWAGFLIVAGFYLLAAIIVWAGREKIIRVPIMNSILNLLFKNDEEDEED